MKIETKIDLYKLHKAQYAATKQPVLVELKEATYLAIPGQGAPGGPLFTASIGALYGMAFTIKMTRKFGGLQDYSVCKLEAQWGNAAGLNFDQVPKEEWQWNLMIRTPEFVTQAELDRAVAVLLKRGKGEEVKRVRLDTMTEGVCVHMLHVGPYEKEHETIAQMKAFAAKRQLQFHGKHHEIYLTDPRRVPPDRLKTILRMPAEPMAAPDSGERVVLPRRLCHI